MVDGVMGRLGWVAVCGMMGVGNHSCWAVSGRMLFLSDQTPCPLLLLLLAGRNPEGEYLGIPQPSCQPTLASLPPSLPCSLPSVPPGCRFGPLLFPQKKTLATCSQTANRQRRRNRILPPKAHIDRATCLLHQGRVPHDYRHRTSRLLTNPLPSAGRSHLRSSSPAPGIVCQAAALPLSL